VNTEQYWKQREEDLAAQLEKDPQNEYLWQSRALCHVALGDFPQAVRMLSLGISHTPYPARLLQERGHRYINLGRHEKAAADLCLAAKLCPEDQSLRYHQALSLYLIGEYAKAERVYRRCLALCDSPSSVISTVNWLWAALQHQGKEQEAAEVLSLVREGMISPDNESDKGYYDLLMLYKGICSPQQVLGDLEALTPSKVTACYGAANYYRFVEKDSQKADQLLCWLLENADQSWHGAFAWQAASAEMSRKNIP